MIARRLEIATAQGEPLLTLEPITTANFDGITEALLPPDAETSKWLISGDKNRLASPDSYRTYIENAEQRAWAIQVDNKVVGLSHLWGVSDEYPGVSTYIMNRQYRGRGLGTLAKVGLIASHVFESENSKEIVRTNTLQGNVAAARSLGKMGFYTYGYAQDEQGKYIWQNVGGELNYITQWLVVNPHDSSGQNEYAQTQHGRASQAAFAACRDALQITVC